MHNYQQLFKNYLDYCMLQKKLSSKTLKAYKIDLQQFLEFSSDAEDPMARRHLIRYIGYLNSTYKPKSVKRKLATLKAFCSYLVYEEILPSHPFLKIRTDFREPVLLPKVIPLEIIQALLKTVYEEEKNPQLSKRQHKHVLRDIAVLELLFATGIRVSELTYLKPENINLVDRTLHIYGKGSKERVLYIENPDVLKSLIVYQKEFASDIEKCGYFFVNCRKARYSEQSVRNMVEKYMARIDYPQHITPHMFRHSFATLLLEADVDIRYIQGLLGHSSVTTTQIYTHISSSKQRKILATKHPRNQILNK
ncbi:tyrosine-type recombinase/integrase [Zhenpiania hominis]|uniref:Tyrosine-type recombinase/integrase n=1 Tax=Zhenpiania hominis TaxID=2763644 RepID=A0A923NPY4_9FIRM|nr:tyrosine-type recombinase/integrase [Zhenpiania hominis]MBC6679973.1 tyrosine-type recombinase/integrase [Zhenpiania hominis]